MNPLDFYFWDRLKDFVNSTNPTTTDEVCDRIQLFMDTEYDQSEMQRAILGTMKKDKMTGGLRSRLNAVWHHGGRSMTNISRKDRHNAAPVPLIGPVNKPLN